MEEFINTKKKKKEDQRIQAKISPKFYGNISNLDLVIALFPPTDELLKILNMFGQIL